jgi:hypothetical protein
MDCLRSFTFVIGKQTEYTTALRFKSWTVGTNNYWLVDDAVSLGSGSKYLIQGFKNINVYKIEITGDVNTAALPAGVSSITENWNIFGSIKGTTSASVGSIVVSPNPFGMTEYPGNSYFNISKYQNSITFLTPIQSAEYIEFAGFYAEGYGNQSILSAQIGFFINVTVFYKYEGE